MIKLFPNCVLNLSVIPIHAQSCYFSKVFGYYNCMIHHFYANFMNAVLERIHALEADT